MTATVPGHDPSSGGVARVGEGRRRGVPPTFRVVISAAVLVAGASPIPLDLLGNGSPLIDVETVVQHINVLTS
ncbi:hypothetical protein FE391_36130 [Nonomuraea sp. KC401]|uniref:hypothetical protein n=1 Tax=unclassified Nonomuraea TaxID=2593643 RepID=UPI0010FD609C|nr:MULTISPECIES: hypothetical protein [unclassified Nonomuraea]NBE97799.1 hypothetical protein [Nonomuraea sp. K271]TLF58626.1 hypothetical protein FE391_36130 [Nonomuraea sp. KC401]